MAPLMRIPVPNCEGGASPDFWPKIHGKFPHIFPLDKSATCVPPPMAEPILWFFQGFAIELGISFFGDEVEMSYWAA